MSFNYIIVVVYHVLYNYVVISEKGDAQMIGLTATG